MPYCTPGDIERLIQRRTLIELTNDLPDMALSTPLPDTVNVEVVEEAIRYADELIDAYLRARYPLPLLKTPTVVKDFAVNLVCHRLYQRRPDQDLPEVIKDAYKATEKALIAVRSGTLTLGVQETQADQPESGEFRVRGRRRRFGGPDGLLEKY